MKTIQLEHSIKHAGDDLYEIEIRRMNAGDIRAIAELNDTNDAEGIQRTLALLQRMTGLPPSTIDQLDVVDMAAAGEVIAGFTQASRKDGKKQRRT